MIDERLIECALIAARPAHFLLMSEQVRGGLLDRYRIIIVITVCVKFVPAVADRRSVQ